MRARTALVKPTDRRAVARPGRCRPQEEHLLQRELALEDVALGEATDALDVGGRDHLPMQDRALEVWCIFPKRIHHRVAELLALRIAPAAIHVVGRVLYE